MRFAQKPTEYTDSGSNSEVFRIRRMAPSDLLNFIRLGMPTCAFMHGRPEVSEERLNRNFAAFVREHAFSDESEIYVAEDAAARHCGQLWLHSTRNRFNALRELWIWDITVAPHSRGKGLGKQLLEFARQTAEARHCEELWLLVSSVNDVAIQLYRTTGYQSAGELMCIPLVGSLRSVQTISFGATILRVLASNDIESLHQLWSNAGLPVRPGGRDSASHLRTFLNGSHEGGWGGWSGDRLVGAALISDDGRKGWIERLAVHPEFRRAGLAKAIVTACMNSLRSRGRLVVGALIEQDNQVSQALFESCGFVNHQHICYYSYRDNQES